MVIISKTLKNTNFVYLYDIQLLKQINIFNYFRHILIVHFPKLRVAGSTPVSRSKALLETEVLFYLYLMQSSHK